MLDRLRSYDSLNSIDQPKHWWKCSTMVDDTVASRTINLLRAAMTGLGLGSKDNSMSTFGTSDEEGRVKLCKLCHASNNNECHFVTECDFLQGSVQDFVQNSTLRSQLKMRKILAPGTRMSHPHMK